MERYIKEFIDFTGEEKGKLDSTINTFKNLRDELEKETMGARPCDLYWDTDHLIQHLESYLRKYYRP